MNENPEINIAITKEEAEKEIKAIMQEVALMGGNDSEIPALNELIKCLEIGNCSSKNALEEAQKILSRKQDYH